MKQKRKGSFLRRAGTTHSELGLQFVTMGMMMSELGGLMRAGVSPSPFRIEALQNTCMQLVESLTFLKKHSMRLRISRKASST